MCKLRVWWLHYIGTSHTLRSPYYENFCTTKVTILWLYIVQNVQVTSMVTALYRHKSHIAITILWKFLYYQGHHTVTRHSTKCASYEYGDCTIRHKSHIAITILWKFLYYQGHHTVTRHSTKCASYEYGDCTIRHKSHIAITILWKFLYYQGHHTVTRHSTKCASYEYGHTLRSPYYENFCTTKVTILLLYIVQNVQVTSMVTALYRHKSHIAITILWKFLYYQGHHIVTLHSTKCASYEYGDCTI